MRLRDLLFNGEPATDDTSGIHTFRIDNDADVIGGVDTHIERGHRAILSLATCLAVSMERGCECGDVNVRPEARFMGFSSPVPGARLLSVATTSLLTLDEYHARYGS